MAYTFKEDKLYYNKSIIFQAPTTITELFSDIVNNRVFLIYRGRNLMPHDYNSITNPKIKDPQLQEAINQNVLCINKNGDIVWRIESTLDYPEDHVRFIKADSNSEGVVWVYRRDAREFMIDPSNGKVLSQRLGM